MKSASLLNYFTGVVSKQLSSVECDPDASHQHEFNGSAQLKELLGAVTGTQKIPFKTVFMYFNDTRNENFSDIGQVTWYDARAKSSSRTGRSEYRLYFSDSPVIEYAKANDLLILAKRPDKTLIVIIAEHNSTIEKQLIYLFNLNPGNTEFTKPRSIRKLDFVASYILKEIGIEVDTADDSLLDGLLSRFNGEFPKTNEFSDYARETMFSSVDLLNDPDKGLIAFLEREEVLFKTLEKHLIIPILRKGFEDNVDAFVDFSLKVQNRRKMRAGMALENHLSYIFSANKVNYSANVITENKSRPDFIFPGIAEYRNNKFPANRLKMLGAKTTCKDRWRQVLSEAKRIRTKHLFTLEPGISENQTDEMKSKHLSLVVPRAIFPTYSNKQQSWLIDLKNFINIVK